jgi:hypothetical protein
METQDVTLPILAAISKLPRSCFWRQNQGKFRTMDGKRVIKATSIFGVADIMGTLGGRAVAIETKTKTGTLAASQKIFRENWASAGGVYIVATSAEDALAALAAL